MTGDSGAHEGAPGRHRTAAEVSALRIELVLLLDDDIDGTNPDTWTIGHMPLTAWQRRMLTRLTPEEWARVEDILALDAALIRDSLEQLRREQIRLRNGLNNTNDDNEP